ncbi:MAG: hypothetical protein Q8M92_01860 [Candidatus Subteraquimicrobiales bacterium]|nr:hypothetical protein [Candidatus Subteraquimicrobiales bacterium]
MVDIKANIKVLAEKAKMTESELEKLYEQTKKDLIERGLPEDKLDSAILSRMSSLLKKKFVSVGAQGTKVRGMLMGRHSAKDWAEWNREKTLDKIKSLGEGDLVEAGCKNADGQLLYTRGGEFSIGKPIPEHDYSADGYGVITFDKDGKLDTRFTNFKLKGEAAIANYPLFTECDMFVRLIDGQDDKRFVVSMNSVPTNFDDDYVNFHEYANYIVAAEEKRIIELGDIERFAQTASEDSDEKYKNWAIVEGSVIKFGISAKGRPGVSIDDASLVIDNQEDVPSYTIWFPPETEFDFADDAIGVTFLVTTMISRDDGTPVLFGMGYWVDDYFRAAPVSPDGESPSVQNSWG